MFSGTVVRISLFIPEENKELTTGLIAAALLNGQFVDGIIQRDDKFHILRADQSSPAFWEVKKKVLFAMIRQLGCPIFFFSCSAADTKWTELIVIYIS
jgi:hypothetical protein